MPGLFCFDNAKIGVIHKSHNSLWPVFSKNHDILDMNQNSVSAHNMLFTPFKHHIRAMSAVLSISPEGPLTIWKHARRRSSRQKFSGFHRGSRRLSGIIGKNINCSFLATTLPTVYSVSTAPCLLALKGGTVVPGLNTATSCMSNVSTE